jgi:hypothetical protein
MKSPLVIVIATLALAVGVGLGTALATQPANPESVRLVSLPLKLPAVGNVDAVRQWRFGRLESVVQAAGQEDIEMRIRTADGVVHSIFGPGPPLSDLARASNWFDLSKPRPGRNDYVERMIAFDVDGNGRLIAAMSLEPLSRSQARLRRAFGNR